MKEALKILNDLYRQQLKQLIAAEKKHLKCLAKLAPAAGTDELKSAISRDSMDIEQNLERLTQCKSWIKGKSSVKANAKNSLSTLIGNYPKRMKSSIYYDIRILKYIQECFMLKIVTYQNLQLMAGILQQEHPVVLLEQCVKDNQNSYSYLVQISANIIYPEALAN
ncbi:hypothetical protein DBR11_01995 [Pedobacter sp. HMWF019]|uniref:DUF892 family protein n=1 Tax=Pedobacter sp. HMWF019 TaxID=2056856 RepID=UPI000D3C20F9|nr:DUF892 family protein [Pedobacter sp. HMWF019]PTT03542.1 hypothetical protein DBR11_01995 [Pedobacter sp. HMWF019]